MEIKVSEIPPEGFRVEITEKPGDVPELGEDVKLTGDARGFFSIKKTGVTVYVKGEVRAEVLLDCSRCGKKFKYPADSEFSLDLNPLSSMPEVEEKELQSGDLEVDFYTNDKIDLGELLREQVLLQLPMKPLCSEDCKGFCPQCGKDLGLGPCECVPETGHPGLAALKDLLKDKGKEGK